MEEVLDGDAEVWQVLPRNLCANPECTRKARTNPDMNGV